MIMASAAISMSKAIAKLLRVGGGSLPSCHGRLIPTQPSSLFCSSATISSVAAAPESTPSHSPEKEKRSSFSKWLLFLPGAITFGLGTWQIFRRQDKVKTLEYRQKRLEMDPLKLNTLSQSNKELESVEFRKVLCKGAFDEDRSIFVGPRSRSISGVTENGYYVITPLIPVSNDPESVKSPILVNRGWVPRIWRDKALELSQNVEQKSFEKEPQSQHVKESKKSSWWKFWIKKPTNVEVHVPDITPVEVVGVIRGSEKPSIFVPANEPSSSQWFYVDVPAIARACGLSEDTIYVEDINEDVNPSCPYPVPKDVNTLIRSSVMPHDHLNYTLTWYSLSAAVTFMAFKRLRPKKSQR